MAVQVTMRHGAYREPAGRSAATTPGYETRISFEMHDAAWDDFLASAPGGHHLQTSLWAQIKALLGWRTGRVVVSEAGQIVAGAQLLIRPLSLFGAIGYVPRGPVTANDDPALQSLVVAELHRVARMRRVQFLAVQPATTGHALTDPLRRDGFHPTSIELAPTATVVVDLAPSLDDLLARMKSKTRYNIRLGQRKGVRVREGTTEDLPAFYRLLVSTGERQQFSPDREDYLAELWRTLAPRGYAKLFLAEYGDEVVSALLAIPFGDTVIYKRGAWSGRHGNYFPNEVMHWEVMTWARAQGYRYYDFEGIDTATARAILRGEANPDAGKQTLTSFKLGFGGQIMLFPEAYDYVYNPLARWAYRSVLPRVSRSPLGARAEHLARAVGLR